MKGKIKPIKKIPLEFFLVKLHPFPEKRSKPPRIYAELFKPVDPPYNFSAFKQRSCFRCGTFVTLDSLLRVDWFGLCPVCRFIMHRARTYNPKACLARLRPKTHPPIPGPRPTGPHFGRLITPKNKCNNPKKPNHT